MDSYGRSGKTTAGGHVKILLIRRACTKFYFPTKYREGDVSLIAINK
jgi:hypothetical protein